MHTRYVCLFAAAALSLNAQDGAKIYNQRCASCHDHPAERVPAVSTIKTMSGEAIYRALTSGSMKTQAEGLAMPDLFALIGFIAPTGDAHPTAAVTPTCKSSGDFVFDPKAPAWNGWSSSLTGSRFQDPEAAGLSATDLPKLKLKWAFNLGDVTEARSQPTVVGGRVFVGTTAGTMYALDARSGCTHWAFRAATGIRGGATIGKAKGKPALFFADGGATVYALDANTGELIWKFRPATHYTSIATATPRYHNGLIYQPIASFEEALAGDPKYQCCTFRGSVAALDANSGAAIWTTYTVAAPAAPVGKNLAGAQQFGPSGAGVWSTPTVDEQRGALYVSTGDNYSAPATATSDAVLALDLKNGNILWSKQLTTGDIFNNGCAIPVPGNCPSTHGADSDFGQPPILVSLGHSKRALVIAQKSGMVHAIDPDNQGQVLWQTKVGAGGPLGGSQWGSASDGRNVYVAISDVALGGKPDPTSPRGFRLVLDAKKGGGLHALNLSDGKLVWTAPPSACVDLAKGDCSPAQSAAVSGISGAVFSGSVDGHLRAYATASGKIVWDFDTARTFDTVNGKPAHGGSIDAGGPAIVGGMLFTNSGYGQWGGKPGNAFLAFSVE
jgi:polyvinyl alcohol dehydrogenase (cytochrome)